MTEFKKVVWYEITVIRKRDGFRLRLEDAYNKRQIKAILKRHGDRDRRLLDSIVDIRKCTKQIIYLKKVNQCINSLLFY